METIVRNVRDLDHADRFALERVVGHQLTETQQVIVNVVDSDDATAARSQVHLTGDDVPAWWRIYEGLSDEQVDELDQAIKQRADLTRDFD